MTQINSTDRILLLLRLQLQKLKEAERKASVGSTAKTEAASASPLMRLKRMATIGQMSEAELEHALIASLLTEEFGAAVANEPKFQNLSKDVLNLIAQDAETRSLLQAAIALIRRP